MPLSLKTIPVALAAEVDNVMLLLVDLVKALKAKGDYSAVMADLLPAVTNVGDLLPEANEQRWEALSSVALRGAQIAKALLEPVVVPVAAAEAPVVVEQPQAPVV